MQRTPLFTQRTPHFVLRTHLFALRAPQLARVLVSRTRPVFGLLIGVGALLLLTLTQAAVLDAMAGHTTGLVVLGLISLGAVRVLRTRD